MASEKEMRFTLLNLIMNELSSEFSKKELTGNLRMSIKPIVTENSVSIEIAAPRYSKKILKEKGILQFTGKGSYASQVDQYGSWYGNHKDYIDRCVDLAIKKWMAYYKIAAKVSDKK